DRRHWHCSIGKSRRWNCRVRSHAWHRTQVCESRQGESDVTDSGGRDAAALSAMERSGRCDHRSAGSNDFQQACDVRCRPLCRRRRNAEMLGIRRCRYRKPARAINTVRASDKMWCRDLAKGAMPALYPHLAITRPAVTMPLRRTYITYRYPMALSATIFKADLNIADMDRNYHADHRLTIARHPSETDERMMVRVLAFACHADEQLQVTRGLSSDDDEPDLWLKDLTGNIDLWIDVGLP